MTTFMPTFTSRGRSCRRCNSTGLRWTVDHAYRGSDFYRRRFDEAGRHAREHPEPRRPPAPALHHGSDLAEGYPFPLRSVPFEDIVRIHSSSGTTGKRKILSYTQKDIDDWRHIFARCYEMAGVGPGDRVQLAVGYGLWTAGVGFQAGCEAVGAIAVPIGPGNLDLQCELLVDLEPTVLCCTASMALLLSEEIGRRRLDRPGQGAQHHPGQRSGERGHARTVSSRCRAPSTSTTSPA